MPSLCHRRSHQPQIHRFWVFPFIWNQQERTSRIRRLQDPFFAVDSRSYQVIRPTTRLTEMGARVLAIEKKDPCAAGEGDHGRPFLEYMIGTQFHPEADRQYEYPSANARPERTVISEYGEESGRAYRAAQ